MKKQAAGLAALGRNGDDTLVHMSKAEVAGLSSLAPGGLTRNPKTGLPEAFKLRDALPYIAGIGGMAFGIHPMITAGLVGGGTALESGNLMKGLSAGLTTYGVGSLGGSLASTGGATGAGTMAAENAAMASGAGPAAVEAAGAAAGGAAGAGAGAYGLNTLDQAGQRMMNAGSGLGSAMGAPLEFLKANQGAAMATGLGSMGMAQQNAMEANAREAEGRKRATQERKEEIQRKFDQSQANFLPLGPVPTMDPYEYAYKGWNNGMAQGGLVSFAQGGMAPMPGQEQPQMDRRSLSDMLRQMYQSKEEAVADLRNPDSPLHKMGIRSPDDPLLDGAFAKPAQYVKGAPGDGMSDEVPAIIDGKQPAALSDGEYVVPADVVSSLGNGSSDAGAKKLQSMIAKVRQEKYGRKRQPPKV